MNGKLIIAIILCFSLIGCETTTSFVEIGGGYTRFETDDIVSTNTINGQIVETKIQHVDGFILKARTGVSPIQAVPQFRTGLEFRGGIGGARDTERVDGQTAFSKLLLLMLGAGPFVSWKQPLADSIFLEAGGFFGGYTVGIHETGRKRNGFFFDIEDESGTGWGGGVFAKIGVLPGPELPLGLAVEFSYEAGKWEFGGDIDEVAVDNYTVLLSSEMEF